MRTNLPPSTADWDELDREISALIRQVQIERAVHRKLRRRRLKQRLLELALPLALAIGSFVLFAYAWSLLR